MDALTDERGGPALSDLLIASLTSIELLDELGRRFRDAGERALCDAAEALAALERTRKVKET